MQPTPFGRRWIWIYNCMAALLVVLPLVILAAIAHQRGERWSASFLIAGICCEAYAIVITEILSKFNLIAFWPIAVAWCVASISVAPVAIGLAAQSHSPGPTEILQREERLLLAAAAFIVVISLVVGWIGPPNNWDSMTYHLVRVVHWIQNHNVAFYPTYMRNQLELSPGAEYVILNVYLLSGGDRTTNLVQWFAFIGCLAGVWEVAGFLGAGVRGQALALVFAATAPSVFLEAVTTQNDLVAAFWVISLIWLTLRILRRPAERPTASYWLDFALFGLCSGSGLMTKATVIIYIAPFAAALAIVEFKRHRGWALLALLVSGIIAASINLPMWTRNYRFTHTLLGDPGNVVPYRNAMPGVGPMISNGIRNIALELSTPFKFARSLDEKIARTMLNRLGYVVQDPPSCWPGMMFDLSKLQWDSEDLAGNPLHLLLFVAAIILAFAGWKRDGMNLLWYAAAIVIAFFGFCAELRWQIFHTRLLMPLLVAAAPFTAVMLERHWKSAWTSALAICLLATALACIVANRRHPFFGRYSIFTADRTSRYFVDRPQLEAPYRTIAQMAGENHCRQVGLMIGSNEFEYPLDVLLLRAYSPPRIQILPGPGRLNPPTSNADWDDTLRPALKVRIEGNSAAVTEQLFIPR